MALSATHDHLVAPDPAVSLGRHGIGITGLSAGYWRDEPVFAGLAMRLEGPGWFQLDGPNGAGKSTLFEVLAGYLAPLTGDIVVGDLIVRAGHRVPTLHLVRAEPAFVPGVTVSDHLHLYARRYGEALSPLVATAAELGLEPHLDKAADSLSTGSLKKAWFVCNWAGDEPVWCLDEPFNGVDAESRARMVELIAERARDSLVLTTGHQLPDGVRAERAAAHYVQPPFVLSEVRHD
nr:ATP-binding cassette domain-containing protein [Propionicimonas sp.]